MEVVEVKVEVMAPFPSLAQSIAHCLWEEDKGTGFLPNWRVTVAVDDEVI